MTLIKFEIDDGVDVADVVDVVDVAELPTAAANDASASAWASKEANQRLSVDPKKNNGNNVLENSVTLSGLNGQTAAGDKSTGIPSLPDARDL